MHESPLFAETGGSGTERYGDGGLRSRQARRLFSESRQNPDEYARKAVYRYDPRKRRSVGGNYRIFDYFCFGPPFDGRVGYLVSDDCGTIDKKLPGASDDGTARQTEILPGRGCHQRRPDRVGERLPAADRTLRAGARRRIAGGGRRRTARDAGSD